jgi:hypothetical protein
MRLGFALHENPRVGFLTVVLDSGLRRNDGRFFSVLGNSQRMRVGQAGPTRIRVLSR